MRIIAKAYPATGLSGPDYFEFPSMVAVRAAFRVQAVVQDEWLLWKKPSDDEVARGLEPARASYRLMRGARDRIHEYANPDCAVLEAASAA